MTYVLDSSAVLAAYLREPGGDRVRNTEVARVMSAVNFSEVEAKLLERGLPRGAIMLLESLLPCETITFDRNQASLAAKLRPITKRLGLSLGDRACLALAIQQKATVLTADKAWADLQLGLEIEIIR
jgi:ribonuclease VapC